MYKKIKYHFFSLHQFITTSRQALVLFLEMMSGFCLTLGSIILFLKIREEVLEKEFLALDMQILHFIFTLRTPALNSIMIFISHLGAEGVVLGTILVTAILLFKKHKREAFLMLFIFVMAIVLNTSIKQLTARPRPQYFPLVIENDFSFPSGHSMTSFVYYATISYFIFHFTHKKRFSLIISASCILLIALIGFSRVYLGVHYPSDVIGGYLGGLAWFTTVILVDKTLIFYKLFRERTQ